MITLHFCLAYGVVLLLMFILPHIHFTNNKRTDKKFKKKHSHIFNQIKVEIKRQLFQTIQQPEWPNKEKQPP